MADSLLGDFAIHKFRCSDGEFQIGEQFEIAQRKDFVCYSST